VLSLEAIEMVFGRGRVPLAIKLHENGKLWGIDYILVSLLSHYRISFCHPKLFPR